MNGTRLGSKNATDTDTFHWPLKLMHEVWTEDIIIIVKQGLIINEARIRQECKRENLVCMGGHFFFPLLQRENSVWGTLFFPHYKGKIRWGGTLFLATKEKYCNFL